MKFESTFETYRAPTHSRGMTTLTVGQAVSVDGGRRGRVEAIGCVWGWINMVVRVRADGGDVWTGPFCKVDSVG